MSANNVSVPDPVLFDDDEATEETDEETEEETETLDEEGARDDEVAADEELAAGALEPGNCTSSVPSGRERRLWEGAVTVVTKVWPWVSALAS